MLVFACIGLWAFSAQAITLKHALSMAYQNNQTLLAKQREVETAMEKVALANSNWRPSITAGASATRTRIEVDAPGTPTILGTPKEASLNVEQPIFRGGSNFAAKDRAENEVLASFAGLHQTEQEVLLKAAQAYLDLIREQAVVRLNKKNEDVLDNQLKSTRISFKLGEVTKTDVAQAEARLAEAISSRIQAEGAYEATKATYEQVVGPSPAKLVPPDEMKFNPGDRQKLITMAMESNPMVMQAIFTERAAAKQVNEEIGGILPQVSLSGSASRNMDNFTFGTAGADTDVYALGATVSVPFYQGGAQASRVRAAKYTASQRRIEIEQARREAREQAIAAWQQLQTAQAAMTSFEKQVAATDLALTGVRKENQLGLRSTLDLLDAEREALDAKISLISSWRDYVLAGFQTLSVIGHLTAKDLNLGTSLYDPHAVYAKVRGKWWGFGVESE